MLTATHESGAAKGAAQITTESTGDKIEALQHILAKQQHRQVSYSEAKEVGDSLVEFYQLLAERVDDELA